MICRLCIRKCKKLPIDIFDEKCENNLPQLIHKHLGLDVKESDNLSSICDVCYKNLDDFNKFFLDVEDRQSLYQQGRGPLTDMGSDEEIPVKEEKDVIEMSESEISFENKDSQSCDVFNEAVNVNENLNHHNLSSYNDRAHSSDFFRKQQIFQQNMEDPELYSLLESWEISHLYNIFHGQKITLKVLKYIQRHHIARLFQELPVGDEVIFEYHLNKWKENAFVCNEKTTIQQSSVNQTKFSLINLLNGCKNGRHLKKLYETKGCFNEQQRVALINSLAGYIDSNAINYTLSDCAAIEKEIVAMFPTEKLEYYTNGKRGRLYNKLSNMKRASKQISADDNTQQIQSITVYPEENVEPIILLMRSKDISPEQFDSLWVQCAQYRFFQIAKSHSTQEILNNWPEYKQHPNGYRLIDVDYQIKYPAATEMICDWPRKSTKIENYLKNKLCNSLYLKMIGNFKDLTEDSKNLILLWSLHQAFPPSTSVVTATSGAKLRKKYSISDSQEAFAIIGSKVEIDAKLKLLNLKGTILPCLLIVGDLYNVNEVCVYFDGVQYSMPNLLKAADICFKLFFVFELNYPEEASVFYKFVEAYIYNIKPPKSTKIATMINELETSC